MKSALSLLLGVMAVACTSAHRVERIPGGEGPLVGLYKAAIDEGRGTIQRASVAIWAQPPDRLHAELSGPLGGVLFVLDAGAGQACVVDVVAATAYAGPDDPRAIEALVGVRVSVADAVAALLSGASRGGLTVTRDDTQDGSLPASVRIVDGGRSLALKRVRYVRGKKQSESLGTGVPPSKLLVLPLENLERSTGKFHAQPSGAP